MIINNIIQFFGFGWIEIKDIIHSNYKGRNITVIRYYRKNKYTKKIQKRTNMCLSNGYDFNHWFTPKKIPYYMKKKLDAL